MKEAAKLDEIDRRILRELRANARIKNTELAERVGLSPTPCWNRVRAMERSGLIAGYTTLLDQERLGLPDTVIVEIMLQHHDEQSLTSFGDALAAIAEVIEAYVISGEYDYLVKVAVGGSAGYERFLREKLYRIPGIRHTRSSFALTCLKQIHSPGV